MNEVRQLLLPIGCLLFLLGGSIAIGDMADSTTYASPERQPAPLVLTAQPSSMAPSVRPRTAAGSGSIDPLRRALSCRRLARRGTDEAFTELVALSRDSNPIVRAHATAALGEFATIAAETALIKSLASKDWRTRRCAAERLAQLQSSRSQAALRTVLDDESDWVRHIAHDALQTKKRS